MNTIGTWNPVSGAAGLAINLIATISPFMLALSVLGYSREQEKEADLEGLKAATAAGFVPDGMPNSFKAMQKDVEGPVTGGKRLLGALDINFGGQCGDRLRNVIAGALYVARQ